MIVPELALTFTGADKEGLVTWSRPGIDLSVVENNLLGPYLTGILPLPPAFTNVTDFGSLTKMDPRQSFLELPTP